MQWNLLYWFVCECILHNIKKPRIMRGSRALPIVTELPACSPFHNYLFDIEQYLLFFYH
jgi:hypothetical protein